MDTFRGFDNASDIFSDADKLRLFIEEYVYNYIHKLYKIDNADASAPLGAVSAAMSGCVLVLTVGLLFLYAVFRRRVEYRLYRVKQIQRQQIRRWKRVREDETLVLEDKKFDAYLSYGEENYPWVRTCLLPLLDNEDKEELLPTVNTNNTFQSLIPTVYPVLINKGFFSVLLIGGFFFVLLFDEFFSVLLRDAHPNKTELEYRTK